MKNLLFLKGQSQYDAMRNYIDEMESACRQLGYNVLTLDAVESKYDYLLKKVIEEYRFDAVVTCNAIFINQWQTILKKRIPLYITYLCDHPSCHALRLQYADENTFVFVCDKRHKAYIERYMKNIKHSAFVPLSGSYVREQINYENRIRDIVFTGSYQNPEEFREQVCQNFTGAMRQFVDFMMDTIIKEPTLDLEDTLKKTLEAFQVQVSDEEFQELMQEFNCVDAYARMFYRDAVVRTLVDNGLKVDIFGNGWEKFEVEHKENLHIEKGNYYAARKAVAETKISLNVMPWFKAGFQERIASAMLSGAVALTDDSEYIRNTFQNGGNIVTYSLENLSGLSEMVVDILNNTEKAAKIAKAGQEYAWKNARWQQRTEEMLEFVNAEMGFERPTSGEGKRLEVFLEGDPYERINSLDAISELEALEELILGVSRYYKIEKEDYDYFKEKLYWILRKINHELPEIQTGDALLNIIFDEQAEVEECMVEMLISECKCILEQLYRKENNFLQSTIKHQMEEKQAIQREWNKAQRHDVEILCRRIQNHYRDSESKEIQEVLDNINNNHRVDAYNYNFVNHYLNRVPESYGKICFDESVGMHYVLADGKRVYYPKSYSREMVFASYRFICIEQDENSPHCYLDERFQVNEGDVVIDAGVAEGNFALEVIDKVKKIYLIECEHEWVEALEKTFEPWKEKVIIIEKMLGNMDDETHISIDGLLNGEKVNFIKMDIEGAETDALCGASSTLKENEDLKCAICAYHRSNAENTIKDILTQNQFQVSTTKGYMFFKEDDDSLINAELRRGIVRGVKQRI